MKIDGVFEKIKTRKSRYQAPKDEEEATKQIEINKRIKEKFLSIVDPIRLQIEQFRVEKGIPKKGFGPKKGIPKRGYENLTTFRRWVNQKAIHAINNDVYFSKGGKDLFLKFKSVGLSKLNEIERRQLFQLRKKSKKIFINRFRDAVLKLSAKIKMDMTWLTQFEEFVLFNIERTHKIIDSGIIIKKRSIKTSDKTIVGEKLILELGPNTRLKDIKPIWMPKIDPILKDLRGYIYLPTNRKK